MNTLVIENQYQQDPEVNGLIEDHPDLFSSVDVITGSLHRKPEELIQEVQKYDGLIVSSTFMRKDQLEEMTELISKMQGLKIYVHRLVSKIEEWTDQDRINHFYDREKFLNNLKTCTENHQVYSFAEDWENKTIKDEVWERMKWLDNSGRGKFTIQKITSL